ncbi:hypothetical protein [Chryseolinea serpens]|uniref:hypothetical protein n=1 Tax=Chryseolinea serpens TaxID=947013 RepID=UPI0009331D40|nr:hypothetical protein [Chryseolinea serpens]
MANVKTKKEDTRDPISKRLDALIRLLIDLNREEKAVMNDGVASRLLKSAGLSPTEIATILGKGSATDVAQYLYSKKRKK